MTSSSLFLHQFFVISLPVLSHFFITSLSVLLHFYTNSSSILYQFFINSSSILHQFFINSSSILHHFFITPLSFLHQFFISSSSVIHQLPISSSLVVTNNDDIVQNLIQVLVQNSHSLLLSSFTNNYIVGSWTFNPPKCKPPFLSSICVSTLLAPFLSGQ